MVFLIVVLGAIMTVTIKIFNQVFRKYDDLNASVQENVSAIRVVKAFVREDFEDDKFSKASHNLYRLFVKAEGLLAFNSPAMMVAVYFCIIMVSWLGAQFIVGGSMSTGDLTSLFSYVMSPAHEPDDAVHGGGHDQHVPGQPSTGSARCSGRPPT